MDSLTLKNLYKVEVKVYIFENHIYTKLPLSELSKDELHRNSYKRHSFVLFSRGQERKSRGGEGEQEIN